MSPLSPSSPPDTDSPLSSSANSSVLIEQLDQLEFDKEEIQTKYEEMKVRDTRLTCNFPEQEHISTKNITLWHQ